VTSRFTEDTLEQAALNWLAQVGYEIIPGGTIAPGEPAAAKSYCFRRRP
jgi:hypothetical protein